MKWLQFIFFSFQNKFYYFKLWQPAQHSVNCSLNTTVWCSNFNILKEYLMRYDRLLKNISGILPEDLAIEIMNVYLKTVKKKKS